MPRNRHDQRHRKGFRVPDSDIGKVFPNFAVTVDCVVVTLINGEPHVLLAKREFDPFGGEWALPGGFKRVGETLEEAIIRQLNDKVHITLRNAPQQLRAYGHPHRDPRPNVVTVVFTALVDELDTPRPGRHVTDVALVSMEEAIEGRPRLAFDHEAILIDARDDIARRLEYEPVVPQLVGDSTTLVELRNLYQSFWQEHIDRGNLRRSLLSSDNPFLTRADRAESHIKMTQERPTELRSAIPSNKTEPSPSGRRPDRYRLTDAWNVELQPIRRPRSRSSDQPEDND